MPVNSFGFEVMSLAEIRDALTTIIEQNPEKADKPLWVGNCPPLFWPIKNIELSRDNDGMPMTMAMVERGGN